jgi:hypothetical protein
MSLKVGTSVASHVAIVCPQTTHFTTTLRPVTLFGTVVAMLAVTILLTRSHATFSMSGEVA